MIEYALLLTCTDAFNWNSCVTWVEVLVKKYHPFVFLNFMQRASSAPKPPFLEHGEMPALMCVHQDSGHAHNECSH